jgi:altronate dehydratase
MESFDTVALILRPDDDVAVLRRALQAGTVLQRGSGQIRLNRDVPAGHKIALRALAAGAAIHKYGQIIGFAASEIQPGDHVHTHNVALKEFPRLAGATDAPKAALLEPASDAARSFAGYLRADGRVGTRNYIAVVSSVNCSASVSRYVQERFRGPGLRRDYPQVDGVVAFTHKGGCVVNPGESHEVLRRVLTGMARHPNVAGYVMIGLGCEGNQISQLRRDYNLDATLAGQPAPAFLTVQGVGGLRRTVEAGIAAVAKLLPQADAARRTAQPLRKLVLAENCGGSDAYSGITANPALGVASDLLVSHGGTSVLAETPEIYGAEHLLLRRATTREVAEKLESMVRWWEEHARLHEASINNNPSFGNKEGGLTTIYEKSLGAVAKGGQAPLAAVYRYAEPITAPGFSFMDTPGFDPVSMTGLVAGGCNIGVFTTGRGSVYGCKPAPCIKVTTNTTLFRWMEEDMDLNAGTILDGTETIQQVGQRIFEKILAVASGERTKSELEGLGDEEFAPWMLGPMF